MNSELRAGFGRAEITPARGARLVGYALRREGSQGQHDPLLVRALVLEAGGERVAIVSLELCYVGEDVVLEIRNAAAAATGIEPDRVLVAATHTHSGPHDADRGNWPDGLAPLAARAIREATGRLEPARVGAGWGMLHGHSLNRRRLEDPVDPAVGVLRIDSSAGPLGLLFTFGCHPVVLGPDNVLGSGDWPGEAARLLERRLGRGAVALFAQAGGADVNPLIGDLGRRIQPGVGVAATTPGSRYYGSGVGDAPRIGDRTGGTFAEMAAMGRAVADEVERVHRGIEPRHGGGGLRARTIPLAPGGAPPPSSGGPPHTVERPRSEADRSLEVMVIGVAEAGLMLVGQPGEVFAESAVRLRGELRRQGIEFPLTVGYANGWRGYLPPPTAYAEGGYEVEWARAVGIGEELQEKILAATVEAAHDRG